MSLYLSDNEIRQNISIGICENLRYVSITFNLNNYQSTYLTSQKVISQYLTHWGRVTHICVSELIIIGADNGLSPGRRQAIIWTNDGRLLIGPSGTKFSEILIEIHIFSFKKMRLKMSSAKWRSFGLGLNVLSGNLPWCRSSISLPVNLQVNYIPLHHLSNWQATVVLVNSQSVVENYQLCVLGILKSQAYIQPWQAYISQSIHVTVASFRGPSC